MKTLSRKMCIVMVLFAFGNVQLYTQNNIAKEKKRVITKLEQSIDDYFDKKYDSSQLNGNVLIVKEGITIFEKSYGYTDGEKTKKLTKEHRFGIGSVYKEFPAVSIMQLLEKDQLELDDKINKFLPDLPSWSKEISIKNLLQYSSGLPMVNWGKYFGANIPVSNEDVLTDLQNIDSLIFDPGTDYLYTNYSPILLMRIVENITSIPFDKYLSNNILFPCKMDGAVMKSQYPFEDKTKVSIPFDSNFEDDSYELSISNMLLTVTASDILNWFEKLDNYEIITKESMRFLSKTVIDGDNIQAPLGFCSWEKDDVSEHTHHGTMGNYECIVQDFKKEKLIVIILTNQKRQNLHEMSSDVYSLCNNK